MGLLKEDRSLPRILRSCCRARVLLVLLLLAGVPFLAGAMRSAWSVPADDADFLTAPVVREDFVHAVSLRGELQSLANTEIRCEARSPDGWIRIVEVVEEGTAVEPGDFLIRLDASALELQRDQQDMICQQREAELVRAKTAYETAVAATRGYVEGDYLLSKRQKQAAVDAAAEKVRWAQQIVKGSERLAAQGFVSARQLEADRFQLSSAQSALKLSERSLYVLDKFTRPLRLTELSSAEAVAKAQVRSAEYTLKRNRDRLQEINRYIAKCEVRAPVAGSVVLAHLHHYGHSHMIQPGEETLENRTMIRLPDPSRMQVKVRVTEDKVSLVKPGQPATMVLEAFPDRELHGHVTHVDEYPEAGDLHLGSMVKQYVALISLDDPFPGMRPGLTAAVTIFAHYEPERLQVPAQAIVQRGKRDYCVRYERGRLRPTEVNVGGTNGETTVVLGGLEPGQRVVLSPDVLRRSDLWDDRS